MPSDEGTLTPLPASLFARLGAAARFAITGVAPTTWFGPQQPLAPMAPPEVKGRQFDYPFGVNIDYTPRSNQAIGFGELRALADALPLLRTIIETRKDQIAASSFAVRLRDAAPQSAESTARIKTITAFLDRPDRRHSFAAWLRMLLEDMLVIDAATIYPRLTRAGALYSLDIIDGSTIKPLIGEEGRAPEAPDPAYQQVLHGIPAADFSCDELLYLPRNGRAHRLYGMSPVEQIAMTINIALRRDVATLDYYRTGTAKIDAGAQLAIADLPSACQIVGQIAALASAYSATGLSGGGAASTVVKAANGASVLANSSLCQNPAAANPVAVSIQILNAVAAVKAATGGSVTAPAAAAAVPAGN